MMDRPRTVNGLYGRCSKLARVEITTRTIRLMVRLGTVCGAHMFVETG